MRQPAIVREYDSESRTCRVEIPGLTDGSRQLPLADIEYPVGARSNGDYPTEIEFRPGDPVWIAFINNDPRYPIVTGYRNARIGNDTETWRQHQINIEMVADNQIILRTNDAQHKLTLDGSGLSVQTSGDVAVNADGDATVTAKGNLAASGKAVTLNGDEAGGLVCTNHACAFTGLAHPQGSTTVKAGN